MTQASLERLWVTSNAPFGVVRDVLSTAEYAVVFDDLNGDFREIELTLYEHGPRGWTAVMDVDDVELSDEHLGYASANGYLLFWGRSRPRAVVDLDHLGLRVTATANERGHWFDARAEHWTGWPADGSDLPEHLEAHGQAYRSQLSVDWDR